MRPQLTGSLDLSEPPSVIALYSVDRHERALKTKLMCPCWDGMIWRMLDAERGREGDLLPARKDSIELSRAVRRIREGEVIGSCLKTLNERDHISLEDPRRSAPLLEKGQMAAQPSSQHEDLVWVWSSFWRGHETLCGFLGSAHLERHPELWGLQVNHARAKL